MSRNCELKMLIAGEKCWILLGWEAQRYDTACKPYEVGQHLLHFVNEDLADIEWTGKIIQVYIDCMGKNLDGSGEYLTGSYGLQNLTLQLIDKLDEKGDAAGELFRVYTQKLVNFEHALYDELVFLRREALQDTIESTLCDLQKLLPFQKKLRDALATFTVSGRNVSEYDLNGTAVTGKISNAQLLWRVIQSAPELAEYCTGDMGFTVINIDNEGEIIPEMLDLPMSNIFRFLVEKNEEELREDSIRCGKMIGEWYEVSDMRRLILLDLIEALRSGRLLSRCATCGKYYWTDDLRKAYCDNPECSISRERMRNYQRRNKKDPYLEEAYRYKNAMIARHTRTVNPSRDDTPKRKRPARLKPMTEAEYGAWLKLFQEQVSLYKKTKAGAVLRNDREKVIDVAGRALLDAVRPVGYVRQKRKTREAF